MKDTGLALRSSVFSPALTVRIASKVEGTFSSLWFPDVSASVDPLDLCALSLGATKRIHAGTGVVRLAELDLAKLTSRASTLARASRNRFILGVGTGSLVGRAAVDKLVNLTKKFRAGYPKGQSPVPIYFAALGPRMVRAAFQNADGVLLNFCSPSYVSRVVPKGAKSREGFRVASYIKLFFAESDAEGRRMLAREFVKYDAIPQYHSMFKAMGISETLRSFRSGPESLGRSFPEKISEISMYNPTHKQILRLLRRFREAGLDTPVIYPYVSGGENYKLRVVMRLRDWVK
jgi:alkanesulfonate monooxygenase SsuD/methylene tetrahydromethanopterin reductase-like flavin-dependent oxidoreductase (luciferase family)